MLHRIFPFINWFKDYKFTHFRLDFISGLTVALVLIPQSMAYAQLANLPAYYGLYAAFLPPMIASMFGSSRQLATGPVAIVSLMTAAALEPIATAGTEAYILYAILLCLMIGIFQFLLGVFRLGLIINFISHPVVNGFTNAGALIIATSQFANLFGVSVEKAKHHYETIYRTIVSALNYTHLPTLGLALLALLIMLGLRRWNPRVPYVLAAVIVTTIISWAIGFEKIHKTNITSIKSHRVIETIENLNFALESIDRKSEERLHITQQIMLAHENAASGEIKTMSGQCRNCHEIEGVVRPESHELLNYQNNLMRLNAEIEEWKKYVNRFRAELKGCLFRAVKDIDVIMFFMKDEVPDRYISEGGTWRLKVGNLQIDETNITMIGGGTVVGNIPKGLPTIGFPDSINFSIILRLLPMVIIISLIGFMEAIAIAKAMATRTGQRLDPNQELIGQGLANIIGSFGKSYPVSGSFSRSAVNIQSGAVTGMSGIFTSSMVIIALLYFTPLMYHLPQSVLAAIIMMAVLGLVNVSSFIHAWQAKKYDGCIVVITFIGTLGFAPHLEWGILIGVALALVESLFRHIRPDIAILSKHSDGSFRNARRWHLKECRYIAVIRFNGSLFFASASYLEDQILEKVATMPDLEHILIVGNGINEFDATGVESLFNLVRRLRERGIEVSITGLNDAILDIFKRTHLYDVMGEDHFYRNVQRAVEAIHSDLHKYSSEDECPLIKVCYKDIH